MGCVRVCVQRLRFVPRICHENLRASLLAFTFVGISAGGFPSSSARPVLFLSSSAVSLETCSCSSFWRRISICAFARSFCTFRCSFCCSRSRSLFVTQSLIRAAFSSTCFASDNRSCRCKCNLNQYTHIVHRVHLRVHALSQSQFGQLRHASAASYTEFKILGLISSQRLF